MNWYEKAKVNWERSQRVGDFVVRVCPDRIAIQAPSSAPISWEDLQKVKQAVIGDLIAIEIFPVDSNVVNLRNTRHLWFGPGINNVVEMFRHPEFEK